MVMHAVRLLLPVAWIMQAASVACRTVVRAIGSEPGVLWCGAGDGEASVARRGVARVMGRRASVACRGVVPVMGQRA